MPTTSLCALSHYIEEGLKLNEPIIKDNPGYSREYAIENLLRRYVDNKLNHLKLQGRSCKSISMIERNWKPNGIAYPGHPFVKDSAPSGSA